MAVTDSILKTIDYAIGKRTEHLMNMDISGIIVSIPDKDGYYNITHQILSKYGIPYLIKTDNRKYIIAKKVSSANLSRNSGTGETGEGGSIGDDDIITNEEIDAMFA